LVQIIKGYYIFKRNENSGHLEMSKEANKSSLIEIVFSSL